MDDADRAGERIDKFEADAIKAVQTAAKRRSLIPIIQEMDGTRFGVCHYCESPIKPGHLFCLADPVEPENSCHVMWEHERKRKEDSGL